MNKGSLKFENKIKDLKNDLEAKDEITAMLISNIDELTAQNLELDKQLKFLQEKSA